MASRGRSRGARVDRGPLAADGVDHDRAEGRVAPRSEVAEGIADRGAPRLVASVVDGKVDPVRAAEAGSAVDLRAVLKRARATSGRAPLTRKVASAEASVACAHVAAPRAEVDSAVGHRERRVVLPRSEVDPVGGHREVPARARAASAHAAVPRSAADSGVGHRKRPVRAKVDSARAVVTRSAADLGGGHREVPARARAVSAHVVLPRSAADSAGGHREVPARARAASAHVEAARSGADSADPRAEPRWARAPSGRAPLTRKVASAGGRHGVPARPASARGAVARKAASGRAPVTRKVVSADRHHGVPARAAFARGAVAQKAVSAEGPLAVPGRARAVSAVATRKAPVRVRTAFAHAAVPQGEVASAVRRLAVPGLARVASAHVPRGEVASAVGHRESPVRGRADSAPAVEAGSQANPHGEPVVGPREVPVRARGASAREAPEPDAEVGSAVERAASAHCPAVAVHEDPAPGRAVKVEVGGVPAGAEPAPASAG